MKCHGLAVSMFAVYGLPWETETMNTISMLCQTTYCDHPKSLLRLVRGRAHIDALDIECGTDGIQTVNDCCNLGDATPFGRKPEDIHRCTGANGGHADLLAWDVIEALHEMILSVPPPVRLAPFALDATAWNIETQKFAEMWAQAQSQLGLTIDATDLQRYDQLKNWNLNIQAKSSPKFGNLTFIGIAKAGSEEIAANLKLWRKKTSATSKVCTLTFVQDPLARFISGYVEFEWRFVQATERYNNSLTVPNYTFHKYMLGSKQPATAFVREIFSFNLIEWLHELPPNLGWFNKHLQESPHLFYRNAIAHICPLVVQLRGKKLTSWVNWSTCLGIGP